MNSDRKIWLCEQYAQQAWTVSMLITQEAARAGEHGRGFAIVANEARTIADKMLQIVETMRFDQVSGGQKEPDYGAIEDCAAMMNLLAVNASIETARSVHVSMEHNIPKCMAVFNAMLAGLARKLDELTGGKMGRKPFVIPEIKEPLDSLDAEFIQFTIGDVPLMEFMGANKIKEVWYLGENLIKDGYINWRGKKIPVIDCYAKLGLNCPNHSRRAVMFIYTDITSDEVRAVPIDDWNMHMFRIKHGRGKYVQPQKGHPFADYSRECWDAVGGDQFVFVDWEKLM